MKHNYLKVMKEALKNLCEELELKEALEEAYAAMAWVIEEARADLKETREKPIEELKKALEARK